MEIQRDFKELLALLNAHKVEYVVVGGYALAFHGVPRYTGDLDIFINVESHNAQKIVNALDEFGFGSLGLSKEDFSSPDTVIQLGVAPVRVDIITSLTGVSWTDAYSHRLTGRYDDLPVFFIDRGDLIKNKKSLGRHRDLADIESLGEIADGKTGDSLPL